MGITVIARLTFREAARRKILLVALILGLLFLVIFGIGFHYILADLEKQSNQTSLITQREICNFIMMAAMYVVNFLTVMMTVLTSVDTLSGEIASGTIHTIVSKPIRRFEVVLGKWLGYAGMLTLYLVLMAGGVLLLVYLRSGYTPPHLLRGVAMLWLNAMLLLSVSLLGGATLSTLTNGVLVFGMFGIAFIGGWIEQIGTFFTNQAASQTAINIGVITSLILPSEALWRRAAYEMQSPLVGAMGFSPFTSRSVPSVAMVIYAALYLVVAVMLAIRVFSRRDL